MTYTPPNTPYDERILAPRQGSPESRQMWLDAQAGYLRCIEDRREYESAVSRLLEVMNLVMQVVDGNNDPDDECAYCGCVISEGHLDDPVTGHACIVPDYYAAYIAVQTLAEPFEPLSETAT